MPSTTASILPSVVSMSFVYHLHYRQFSACLVGGVGLLLASCGATPLPSAAYRAYLADPAHGLAHTAEANGATVTCTYRPIDLLVWQDIASMPAATPAAHDSLTRAYTSKTYCTLTLARQGNEVENQFINDPATYQQVLTYLNTGIAADAFLATTPHDSVPAAASMYVRQYGTTGHSTLLLVFDTHQLTLSQGFHLTLRGQRLGLGTLRFFFTAPDLAALPPLKFD